jgi:serine/threonine protein kinase
LTTLIAKKKETQGFTENEALIYLSQMLIAIEYMHNQDIWHRDLKPDNIFIDVFKNGIYMLKIGDFGSARQDLLNSINNNLLSYNVGTPAFLPPEIIKELPYNAKFDIWCIGVIFYQLLTLSHPFMKDEKQREKDIKEAIEKNVPFIPETISSQSKQLLK